MAQKYDVFTREQGEIRPRKLLMLLLEKVDKVPPSIMVVTAGIYSNWGTSRLALQANDFYLSEIWYEDKGMKPLDDPEAQYRYKIYANIEECIADKALKINSHINYEYVRAARKMSRDMNYPPYSPQLVTQMMQDSNLPNIAGLIDFTETVASGGILRVQDAEDNKDPAAAVLILQTEGGRENVTGQITVISENIIQLQEGAWEGIYYRLLED